jgi:hypothetical protein
MAKNVLLHGMMPKVKGLEVAAGKYTSLGRHKTSKPAAIRGTSDTYAEHTSRAIGGSLE